jgi:O-antigen ligase
MIDYKAFRARRKTSSTREKSIFLVMLSTFGVIAALPIAFSTFFIWPESLARQAFVVGGMLAVLALALQKQKYRILTVSVLLFTQFSTSLHTFDLAEPLKFQIFFLDVLLLIWFVASIEVDRELRTEAIARIWLLMLAWMLVTTYFSARPDKSILFDITMLKSLLVFLVARNIVLEPEMIQWFYRTVAVILVIQGLFALMQYLKNDQLGLIVLGERDPEASELHYVHDSLRVSGTLGAVNTFAGYIAMLLVFITPVIIMGRAPLYLYPIYLMSMLTLILPFSRAGWLSYLVGSMVVVYNLIRIRSLSLSRTLLAGAFACIVLAGLLFAFQDRIMERFEDRQAKNSALGRVAQFVEAIDVIKRYPIVGIGPGVTAFFGAWKDERKYVEQALPGVQMYNQYHNSLLQFWVENGALGVIIFILFLGYITYATLFYLPGLVIGAEWQLQLIVIGAAAGGLAFLIHASFGPEINNERLLTTFALMLGVARNKGLMERRKLKIQAGLKPLAVTQNKLRISHHESAV